LRALAGHGFAKKVGAIGVAPGARRVRNKTYPINESLEAPTLYNRGYTLEEDSRQDFLALVGLAQALIKAQGCFA
jgi:hypothetical protein